MNGTGHWPNPANAVSLSTSPQRDARNALQQLCKLHFEFGAIFKAH